MDEAPEDVLGAERLVGVFGYWPSFHDAEVVRFCLDREGYGDTQGPTVECVVHVFETTSEVGPTGYYILKNHSLVTFRFLEVDALELSGFNHQNVLWTLDIKSIAAQQLERVKFAVTFAATWGMGAAFQCFGVAVVSVQPCDQEGNAIEL